MYIYIYTYSEGIQDKTCIWETDFPVDFLTHGGSPSLRRWQVEPRWHLWVLLGFLLLQAGSGHRKTSIAGVENGRSENHRKCQ